MCSIDCRSVHINCRRKRIGHYWYIQVCVYYQLDDNSYLNLFCVFRVPGNTAAITSLTDAVNSGGMETPDMADKLLQRDPRWTDVNVISSLLKSFFRRLPDALLTTEMYPHFIEADKIDDPVQRMVKLRELVCPISIFLVMSTIYLI